MTGHFWDKAEKPKRFIVIHCHNWLDNMVERRSKSKAGDTCSVDKCDEPSKRSLPQKKVRKGLPELKFTATAGRAHLCRKHYKEYKKATKSERTMDRLGMMGGK